MLGPKQFQILNQIYNIYLKKGYVIPKDITIPEVTDMAKYSLIQRLLKGGWIIRREDGTYIPAQKAIELIKELKK